MGLYSGVNKRGEINLYARIEKLTVHREMKSAITRSTYLVGFNEQFIVHSRIKLVSLAVVIWMSRNVPPKERCVTSKKRLRG